MKCKDCRHVGCAVGDCPYGKKEPDQAFQDDCLFQGNCAIITAFLKCKLYDAAINQINKMRNHPKAESAKTDTQQTNGKIKPRCRSCKKRAKGCKYNEGNYRCFKVYNPV